MPFVRVSRDKRGYEHIYLVHATTRRGKPSRPRILYWYRTPPGVMVGREPFDESVRRALEAQYPDVTFDWEELRKTAVLPPDVEHWRERRRVERAAKQARQAGERDESEAAPTGAEQDFPPPLDLHPMPAPAPDAETQEGGAPSDLPDSDLLPDNDLSGAESSGGDDETDTPLADVGDAPVERVAIQAAPSGGTPQQAEQRRRRRRRGGRRRRPSSGPEATPSNTPSNSPKEDEPLR